MINCVEKPRKIESAWQDKIEQETVSSVNDVFCESPESATQPDPRCLA